MSAARFPLALCIAMAAAMSGCARKLPGSAEALLLRHLNAQKIIKVHDVRHKTVNGFDYLGLFATFEVESNFERWYHPEVILRKKSSESDWSHAEVFFARQRMPDLFALPDAQFEQALCTAHRSPNQALQPTAGRRLISLSQMKQLSMLATSPAASGG